MGIRIQQALIHIPLPVVIRMGVSPTPSRATRKHLLLAPPKVAGLLSVLASAQARIQDWPAEGEESVNEQSPNKRDEESIEGEREGGGGEVDRKRPGPIYNSPFTISSSAAEGITSF
ncbi:hypothetical protein DFJ43DRAFT_1159877 [Lentinula guzmanii]|uniref:Uncharacterized protein n=1 Tax=Lentinula guzmanii TaxID=2804957 RepID=A0AA38J3J9_9AGAR|nr:hypothetical protein DFJ43DRAFT_1159877 [Lentinula guzmanii]